MMGVIWKDGKDLGVLGVVGEFTWMGGMDGMVIWGRCCPAPACPAYPARFARAPFAERKGLTAGEGAGGHRICRYVCWS